MKSQQKMESAPSISTGPEKTGTSGEVLAGMDGSVERISEVVGEQANESGGSTGAKPIKSQKKDHKNLEFKKKIPAQKILPKEEKQKKELTKALERKTNKLIAEAMRVQNAKDFEPHKLEQILREIRHVRHLLKEIVNAGIERISELYKKFVWNK